MSIEVHVRLRAPCCCVGGCKCLVLYLYKDIELKCMILPKPRTCSAKHISNVHTCLLLLKAYFMGHHINYFFELIGQKLESHWWWGLCGYLAWGGTFKIIKNLWKIYEKIVFKHSKCCNGYVHIYPTASIRKQPIHNFRLKCAGLYYVHHLLIFFRNHTCSIPVWSIVDIIK